MDTLQCAIILAKLEKFDWEVEQRLRIGKIYNKLLNEIGVAHIQQRSDRTSVFAQYVVISESRDILQKYLNDVGVPTAVHYPMPINEQPAFKYFCPTKSTPNAQHMAKQVLSPPMGPYLTLEEQKLIVGLLSNFYH
jgi:UDP-2-acetamido-2-deoxy-ribo-hexuluronate aminotransferase